MTAPQQRISNPPEPYKPHGRTLGEFLCAPNLAPPYIDVDQLPWQDIKQDACLRAIVALRRAGKPVGPDPVAAFDAEPKLVMTAYKRAYVDALRRHVGYGPGKAGARWTRLVSLDHGLEELADRDHEIVFERILERITARAKVVMLMQQRYGGASPATLYKLLLALRKLQKMKESGNYIIPAPIRSQLYRFRSTTGLPVDTDLL